MSEAISKPRGSSPKRKRCFVSEVLGADALKRRAKGGKSLVDGLRVCRLCLDQEVEVSGKTGLRVNGYGVGSNDQVLNAVLVQ
ncbi:MAG TPA: hypothetical protein VGD62_11555, partial [Acidobacteriaceae bacterium]